MCRYASKAVFVLNNNIIASAWKRWGARKMGAGKQLKIV